MSRAVGGFRTLSRLIPVLAVVVCLPRACPVSPLVPAGGLKGVVADLAGHPRMGAVVLLFNRQDKLIGRAVTNGEGGFVFGDLLPDVYSVRVSLAAFLPAIKDNIRVQ